MRQDPVLAALPHERLEPLFRDMFIYTHGLCTLTAINTDKTGYQALRKILHTMGGKLIALTIMEEKNENLLEETMKRYHP